MPNALPLLTDRRPARVFIQCSGGGAGGPGAGGAGGAGGGPGAGELAEVDDAVESAARMEEQQPEAAAAADPEAAAAAAAAAEKKRLKNQRKKQKQKAKKAAEEGEGGGGGAGAAAAEGAAEPEPAQGADGEAENDTALDAAALKKKEANRKKRERKKAKAAADKAAGPAWVEERLVQLKAERAARDAADEPKAVYPYKQWLDTSNGWSGPLRPAYVAPQRKVTDPDIAKPDYADDPDGTPHGEMEEMAGRSIKQVRYCVLMPVPTRMLWRARVRLRHRCQLSESAELTLDRNAALGRGGEEDACRVPHGPRNP